MSEQRTPDELTAENELICTKLLGWKLGGRGLFGAKMWLDNPNGDDGEQWHTVPTPSFTTWADAGLLLDRMSQLKHMPRIGEKSAHGPWYAVTFVGDAVNAATGPLAVREAALEYVRRTS